MEDNYTWVAHPDLVVMAIKSLVKAVGWLAGIIGTGFIAFCGLLKYIDHHRMKMVNEMANDIKGIAHTLTVEFRAGEHRFTVLEGRVDKTEQDITDIRALCKDRLRQEESK